MQHDTAQRARQLMGSVAACGTPVDGWCREHLCVQLHRHLAGLAVLLPKETHCALPAHLGGLGSGGGRGLGGEGEGGLGLGGEGEGGLGLH